MGIGLQQLGKDVAFLKKRILLDVKGKSEGRLVIRNEKSSEVFTTEVITKILKEEGNSSLRALASLGHTLQGGVPSPLERVRATRLALKCCEFLESEALKQRSASSASSTTSKIGAEKFVLGRHGGDDHHPGFHHMLHLGNRDG